MLRPRKLRPNLAPMIDVVFLLLLFFLLTTQLSGTQTTEVFVADGGAQWADTPLLVELGVVNALNGKAQTASEIEAYLTNNEPKLMAVRVDETIDVQALLSFKESANALGWQGIVLVENR